MSIQDDFEKAQKIFVAHGECKHNPDFFTDVDIPNSDSHFVSCKVCHKNTEKYYGFRSLRDKILEYLELGSKTREQIYFRFDHSAKDSIRGRLSELKRTEDIFSIEKNLFTIVEKEKILA